MRKSAAVFFFLIAVAGVQSCGGKDTICACIEAGNALNRKANAILENGSTKADEAELQSLKTAKKEKCAEFEKMGGDEMRERMQSCE